MSGSGRPWRLIFGTGGAGDSPGAGLDSGTGIEPVDGATNMAVDAALLEAVRAGASPILRLYRWSPATLSFGRNQPARGRYDVVRAQAGGIDFVRRPTGGQAVLHDDELTYAVVAPVAVLGRPRAAYRLVNRALVAGLRRLGVEAGLAGDALGGPAGRRGRGGVGGVDVDGPDWDAACFRRPERGEVVVGGAKLVGSAQRMEGRTILQHGSILVAGSQAPAESLLLETVGAAAAGRTRGAVADGADPTGPVPKSDRMSSSPVRADPRSGPGWTTLERVLGGRPEAGELVTAIQAGFREVLGEELRAGPLTDGESGRLEELVSHYRSEEWTWRR